jgi:hypothetical protein
LRLGLNFSAKSGGTIERGIEEKEISFFFENNPPPITTTGAYPISIFTLVS